MHESVLRDYFLGLIDELHLSKDLADSVVRTSHDVLTHYITDDFSGDFEVNAGHLVRVCDAFLNGTLNAEHLELIGFALEASEQFLWENDDSVAQDSPVAKTIHAWASPEINYPLTVETVAKFKHLLLTSETLFTIEDLQEQATKNNR